MMWMQHKLPILSTQPGYWIRMESWLPGIMRWLRFVAAVEDVQRAVSVLVEFMTNTDLPMNPYWSGLLQSVAQHAHVACSVEIVVAQKGATYPIEVFRTCDGRGWAVRALRDIRRGAFIGEYTGELLSDAEMNRAERTDTYFFETRVGKNLYTVDARLYGNFTRFINHSCRPNAAVAMVIWEAQLEQLNHICIFATENICKGDEITISYGQSWWKAKLPQFSCKCGHDNCEYSEDRRIAELHCFAAEMSVNTDTRAVSMASTSSSDDSDEKRSFKEQVITLVNTFNLF
ncbi:hypothetical protein KIN20_011221 [Parelaphostrongylus tenuis]|uniref:SET domain-containing protein n=1 Tax=Parelaphostrongylus tenuis TaxID=148309 RepID=A0AAD5MCI7_PARTN|nr:hypothetical protein KIN20_011221 [Parelaphostrongylus tenuis]